MVDTDELVELGIKALENTYKVHEELGDKGLESVQKNPHGETSLVGDIEAEKAIIDTFREANVPLRIISEEHGQVDLTDNPQFLAVLDGLDGTSVYKKERGKGRYGTMFGIFSNLNPTYDDYVFSGVMEHSTRRLFYAIKGKGSFVIIDGKRESIHCSDSTTLDRDTRIYVDEYFDVNRRVFSSKLQGFRVTYSGSSAAYYVDLASGNADLALECTRKGNLEIAVAYGLETESGGCIVNLEGTSLGSQKYLEFGHDKHVPMISASTLELAQELIRKIQ